MGIFKRIWNWLCSLFRGRKKDSMSDFERYVREMQEALGNMKTQTEAVLAAQEKRKREIAQCEAEIAKMNRYAEKAVGEGNDRDARFFLEKKAGLECRLAELTKQLQSAAGYTSQAEALQRRAENQLNEITARKDAVKARIAAAELMESMNRLEHGELGDAMEAQAAEAQAALDKAEALAELEGRTGGSELEALMSKYDQEEGADGELAEGIGTAVN